MHIKTTFPLRFVALLAALATLALACDSLDDLFMAFERYCAAPEIVVTRFSDTPSGLCSATSCSLRQAVTTSNACNGIQTIRIPAGTYLLTRVGYAFEDNNLTGDLDILDSVNIAGAGMPVIDGNHTDRIFDIKAGATVTMTGLVIQNGRSTAGAVGILNWGSLTATEILVQNNLDTSGTVAGVANKGTAFFYRSAIVNNISRDIEEGIITTGGLYNDGQLVLENVTVSNNGGCGLMNLGVTIINFSTIADNLEHCEILNGSTLNIGNSIIGTRVGLGNCRGRVISNGFNIDTSYPGGAYDCGLNPAIDLIGVDPRLLPVLSYAGSLPVRPLLPGSLAIDTADAGRCPGTDQRGVTRPQGPACDRGAFEWNMP